MTKRDLQFQVAKVTISVIGPNNDSMVEEDKHHGESKIYMYSSCPNVFRRSDTSLPGTSIIQIPANRY